VITDPSLFDLFNEYTPLWDKTTIVTGRQRELFSTDFSGEHRLNVKTFMCRFPSGELNGSNNPTFSKRVGQAHVQDEYVSDSGRFEVKEMVSHT
jgi:hypothetical protein